MANIIFENVKLDGLEVPKQLTKEEYIETAKRFAEFIYKFTQENGVSIVAVIMAPCIEPPEGGIYRASIIHAQQFYFRTLLNTLADDMNRVSLMSHMNTKKN